ncbi:MAG: hypothetical protein AAF196_00285 [Planctomycetota bacterium]
MTSVPNESNSNTSTTKRRGPLRWLAIVLVAYLGIEGVWAGLSILQRHRHPLRPTGEVRENVVLFVGDSTFYGTGFAERADAPPSRAARDAGRESVDHSFPGLVPPAALRRLPQALSVHRPGRVVVALGMDAWTTNRMGPPDPMPEWLRGFEFSDSLIGGLFTGGEVETESSQTFVGRWHKGNADIRFLQKNNLCLIGTIVGNWSETSTPGELEVTVAGVSDSYRFRYRFEGKQMVLEGETLPDGSLVLDPGPPPAGPIEAADAYGRSGDYELARVLVVGAMQNGTTPALLGELGYIDARLGDLERARRALTHLDALEAPKPFVDRAKAMVHLALGEIDQAVRSVGAPGDHAPDRLLYRRLAEHGRSNLSVLSRWIAGGGALASETPGFASVRWLQAMISEDGSQSAALDWAVSGPAGLSPPSVFEAMALSGFEAEDERMAARLTKLAGELRAAAKDLESSLEQFRRVTEAYGADFLVYQEPGRAPALDLALRNLVNDNPAWTGERILRAFTSADQQRVLFDALRD